MRRGVRGGSPVESGTSPAPGWRTVVGTENLNVGHHVVQFYGHDEGSSRTGPPAICLAQSRAAAWRSSSRPGTPARVSAPGCGAGRWNSPPPGTAARYLVLDASETLRELMAADGLDRTAFNRVIGRGGQARRGGRTGPGVRRTGRAALGDGLVNDTAAGGCVTSSGRSMLSRCPRLRGWIGDPRDRRLRRGAPRARGGRRLPAAAGPGGGPAAVGRSPSPATRPRRPAAPRSPRCVIGEWGTRR